jgi:PAS domain S-box-containing protein
MDVEMAAHPHVPHVSPLRDWPALGTRATLSVSLALFAAVFVLRVNDSNVGDAESTLFLVPIAALALRFGLRGGLAGALVACALVVAWVAYDDVPLSAMGYLSRCVAFLVLGALFGSFVDHRRRLEAEILRHSEASLDLLATADLTGRFTRVNPAWQHTLGHSAETLCSQPYLEFVHPDDREATIAEASALTDGSRDTVRFRNRYRTADGSYRWLEWSAHASPSEGVIHAVARDITIQHEAEQQLSNNATLLETKVAERTRELDAARTETLQRLAIAAEYRDGQTSQHTERVGASTAEIARRLGLDSEQIRLLGEAAPLHDVGKLAIPDRILLKPGKLSAQEWEVMKTHTSLGAGLLSGSSSPVLQMAALIAENHHERWDGTGYPNSLAGEAIPFAARIVAVADVFDALTHIRPYKSAWPVEEAIAEITRAAGSHLDPRVVNAFLTVHKEATASAESASPQRPRRPTRVPRKPRKTQDTPPVPASARRA